MFVLPVGGTWQSRYIEWTHKEQQWDTVISYLSGGWHENKWFVLIPTSMVCVIKVDKDASRNGNASTKKRVQKDKHKMNEGGKEDESRKKVKKVRAAS